MPDSPYSYQDRLSAELAIFENPPDIHALPEIHYYWANRHLSPKLARFGFETPDDLFYETLRNVKPAGSQPLRFLSLGAGRCTLELNLASRLESSGARDFMVECLDLNPESLRHGRAAAEQAGLAQNFEFGTADLNLWAPFHEYDAVIANQSLHHVFELEHLFGGIRRALRPGGPFLISDMIGRNGHRRWPEALAIVEEFWRRLPPSYRFNRLLNRFEERFEDWDCSVAGFEGVRSQDVLPLLTANFPFEFFFGFANIIDPFVDRPFGHNFDPCQVWVRRFIDEVHARDEAEQLAGNITPTHLFAVARNAECGNPVVFYLRSPRDSVRDPDGASPGSPGEEASPAAYDPAAWPERIPAEFGYLSRSLDAAQRKAAELVAWGEKLEGELEERTTWAFDLNAHNQELIAILHLREDQLETREREFASLHQKTNGLERELEDRTAWAQRLEALWEERTQWARSLEEQLTAERSAAAQLVYLRPKPRRIYLALQALWRRMRRIPPQPGEL